MTTPNLQRENLFLSDIIYRIQYSLDKLHFHNTRLCKRLNEVKE